MEKETKISDKKIDNKIIKKIDNPYDSKFKSKKKKVLLISGIILGVIMTILAVSVILYFRSPEVKIGLGADIESFVLSEDGKTAYVQLMAGSNGPDIKGIKFNFEDAEGNKYYYETNESVKNISVSFIPLTWWEKLLGKEQEFTGNETWIIPLKDIIPEEGCEGICELGPENLPTTISPILIIEDSDGRGAIEISIPNTASPISFVSSDSPSTGSINPPPSTVTSSCGDNTCNTNENCQICEVDCGECAKLNIWTFSDTHFDDNAPINWSNLIQTRINNMKGYYDKAIIAGDIVQDSSNVAELTEFNNFLINNNLKDDFFLVTGNHDVLYGNGLVPSYYLANIQSSFNYTVEYGNILFIMMGETNETNDETNDIPFSTYLWFNKTVAENQDKIIIVTTHRHLCIPELSAWDLCLSYTDYFNQTLNNYNIDAWIYGHTHFFKQDKIKFDNNNSVLFINSGQSKCANDVCNPNGHSSIILTFTNNSDNLNLKKVTYEDNNVTPIFENLFDSVLNFNFCTEPDCVENSCTTNLDCAKYELTKACDTIMNKCVRCVDDSVCSNLTPACTAKYEPKGECITCTTDSHCTDPTPACSSNTCIECTTDTHCTGHINGNYCINNFCGECYDKSQCRNNEYCWFDNSCKTISCNENKDCEDFDDCSEDRCVNGFCNFTKVTNEEDCYYCTNSSNTNSCNQVGGFNLCGGADINKNGSVGSEDNDLLNLWYNNDNCNYSNLFCNYSDIDRDGGVNFNDFLKINTGRGLICNLEPWRACELGMESQEILDGFDNNCNGVIDETCISKPYFEETIIYNNINSPWFDQVYNGETFRVSPIIDVGLGNEINHYKLSINYSGDGVLMVSIGHHLTNNLNGVMASSSRHSAFVSPVSREEIYISSNERGERYSWIILNITGDITINKINYTYWKGNNTLYGHEARNYSFAGSYQPYRIMYPKNYNSCDNKKYPLVVSVHGSGETGNDNIAQMRNWVFGSKLFANYYQDEEFEAFSIMPQIPQVSTPLPDLYFPNGELGIPEQFHTLVWRTAPGGFFAASVESLIYDLLANDSLNIDENRIYFTGYSMGGGAAYDMMRQNSDLWAAVWPVSGWAIGSIDGKDHESQGGEMYISKPDDDPLIIKFKEEIETSYKNIPIRTSVGTIDMINASIFACTYINNNLGDCILEVFQGVNHFQSPHYAYSKEPMRWLFNQTKECIDKDNDGYFPIRCGNDCKDNDPDINPSAPEICDSIDDNCNKLIDDSTIDCMEDNCVKGICLEDEFDCLVDSECLEHNEFQICNTDRNVCVRCFDDLDCSAPTPACSYETEPQGECVGCVDDNHCNNPTLPGCLDNTCVECVDDNHCIGNLNGDYCLNNYCVECLEQEICTGSNEYCWFDNACKTISCNENKDCEDFDDCSEDRCVNGFCNFTKVINEEDCYYCGNFSNAGSCNQVNGFNLCGGPDLNKNGSVGIEENDVLNLWYNNENCNYLNLFCNSSDINRDGGVNFDDFLLMLNNPLESCNLEPWRVCELGGVSEEICDGFDNDCNGLIDDNCITIPSLSFWGRIIEFFNGLFGG